jgi:hypothetical protein
MAARMSRRVPSLSGTNVRETGQTDGLAIDACDACQEFTQQLPQIKQSATTKKPQR